jgi:P pilus assembly chaperone PapD
MNQNQTPSTSFTSKTSLFQRSRHVALSLSMLAIVTLSARAEMIIETTRVIYREGQRDVSFKVTNKSTESPAFVQMWLDDGNQSASPEEINTPFTMTPPVARVNAGRSQVVRLVYTGEKMPSDKESVYWFNMLEVPPKSEESNKLTLAIRSRIKLFYRPKGLPSDPMAQTDKLEWRVMQNGDEWELQGHNPTPFHMSLYNVTFGADAQARSFTDGGMLAPQSRGTFVLKDFAKHKLPTDTVTVNFINDYGAVSSKTFSLKQTP